MPGQGSNVKASSRLGVFLCHASEDKPAVLDLYRRLKDDGVDPWLDEEKLLLGQEWEIEIPKAVQQSHVVLVCLTAHSVNKEGYVQKEIKTALDEADKKPGGTIYIIVLRLEECTVPERLGRFQYGNLFEPKGYAKLLLSLGKRARQLHLTEPRQLIGAEEALALVWSVLASPVKVRSEGLSELVGDIEIVLPKGRQAPPQGKTDLFDVWVTLSTNITSPPLGHGYSSASLMVEYLGSGTDAAPCATARFQAKIRNDTQLVFESIPVTDRAESGRQVLRITGIRVNASGVGSGAPIGAVVKVEPQSPGLGVPVLADSAMVLAVTHATLCCASSVEPYQEGDRQKLVFSCSTGMNVGFIDDPAGPRPDVTLKLVFQELFKGVFRSRIRENFSLNSAEDEEAADLLRTATNGTRFVVRFKGIPENVSGFVTITDATQRTSSFAQLGCSPRAVLVSADWNGIGGSLVSPTASPIMLTTSDGVPLAPLNIRGGNANAVWEWVDDDPRPRSHPERLCFGVVLSARPGEAAPGCAVVNGGLAPMSTVFEASASAPVPRFVDAACDKVCFEFR